MAIIFLLPRWREGRGGALYPAGWVGSKGPLTTVDKRGSEAPRCLRLQVGWLDPWTDHGQGTRAPPALAAAESSLEARRWYQESTRLWLPRKKKNPGWCSAGWRWLGQSREREVLEHRAGEVSEAMVLGL